MPEVLIRNADYVVTVDKDRRMIRDGAIAISGNTIVAVGKTSEVAPRYPHAEVIDARGKLAMPSNWAAAWRTKRYRAPSGSSRGCGSWNRTWRQAMRCARRACASSN
jgi:hypothetical protein